MQQIGAQVLDKSDPGDPAKYDLDKWHYSKMIPLNGHNSAVTYLTPYSLINPKNDSEPSDRQHLSSCFDHFEGHYIDLTKP